MNSNKPISGFSRLCSAAYINPLFHFLATCLPNQCKQPDDDYTNFTTSSLLDSSKIPPNPKMSPVSPINKSVKRKSSSLTHDSKNTKGEVVEQACKRCRKGPCSLLPLPSPTPTKSLNELLGIDEKELRAETRKRSLGARKRRAVWSERREKIASSLRKIRKSLDRDFRMSSLD